MGMGQKLGTPKLWMVNTKLDIHICGPLGLPFWPTSTWESSSEMSMKKLSFQIMFTILKKINSSPAYFAENKPSCRLCCCRRRSVPEEVLWSSVSCRMQWQHQRNQRVFHKKDSFRQKGYDVSRCGGWIKNLQYHIFIHFWGMDHHMFIHFWGNY